MSDEDVIGPPRGFDTSGEHTTIAEECFTDGNVISYKGENYYRSCDEFVSDNPDGGQSFCVKRVLHPGMYHEDYVGNQKLIYEAEGKVSRDSINVIWPRLANVGTPITKADLKAAWGEIIAPIQRQLAEEGKDMSLELMTLMAAFRHIYGAMPPDEE